METNNWMPPQPGGEPPVEGGDWRAQLSPDSRRRIVNKIIETLKRHLPTTGPGGINELRKIASRFEEKIFIGATDQPDYLRKISLKMLSMENKSQNSTSSSLLKGGSSVNPNKPLDSASQGTQSQVLNQTPAVPVSLPSNQSQMRQQLLSQNIQNSGGIQNSSQNIQKNLQSPGSTAPGLLQNSNTQNISGISQNSTVISMGQGVPSNMFASSQRQMQGRQVLPQQHSQNPQYLCQQQIQQHRKQKLRQANLPHSLAASQMPQQPQQNLLQASQLQPSQQAGMQRSPGLQQNQQPSIQQSAEPMLQQQMLKQPQQVQQAAPVHHQQVPPQQQQPMGQQMSAMNIQQNQLLGQQNSGDIQPQPQQHRLLSQQNNFSNLPQQQQQPPPLMLQQNFPNMHEPQLGAQGGPSPVQQPQQQNNQLVAPQNGNFSMQSNQQAGVMLPQSTVHVQPQIQQPMPNLLTTKGQQTQSQALRQQMMPQLQQQQQMGPQRDTQQKLQASVPLQPQNVMDHQKQLYQSQRALPENPSTSLDSTAQTGNANDWQEEVYQKIKAIRERHLAELSEIHQKLSVKMQQQDALPQQPKPDHFKRLEIYKMMLERIIAFISVSKSGISATHKEKLSQYEKNILHFINNNRPRRPMAQGGQFPPTQMHLVQQTLSQVHQSQSQDNKMNPQLQPMNLQSAGAPTRHGNIPSMQHNSVSPLSGVSTSQQSLLTSPQQNSSQDLGQLNAMNHLQQGGMSSLQQHTGSTPQPSSTNPLSVQVGNNSLQSSINARSQPNMLQQQQLKQQQEQQILQSQQFKQQLHRRQIQHQLLQKQQQQQMHLQPKQQVPGQMQSPQMLQLHQMNDAHDPRMRQGMSTKAGLFLQHASGSQRLFHPVQKLKPGPQMANSSSQLVQAPSPQTAQHSSPLIDQQNLPPSVSKSGTPLQSANSPLVAPSPVTPSGPSSMPGDAEKPVPSTSTLHNPGSIAVLQATGVQAVAPSLSSAGKLTSPLAEIPVSNSTHFNALTTDSDKNAVAETSIERLLKAVKSVSSKALAMSISDIGSVVGMTDRIAGSAPGDGSRASVGEDLVAMTKCRLQAKRFVTHEAATGTKKMKRFASAMPVNVGSHAGSLNGNLMPLNDTESEMESTASSSLKRQRLEPRLALLEEIKQINQRLIDTIVDISEEDVDSSAAAAGEGGGGTIVKCSFSATALSPSLKSEYASAHMSPIQPLRLLVPASYPNCSPVLLDKFPVETSKELEDLSLNAKSRFSKSLRTLSQPMSLKDIAQTWDNCARAVMCEYAEQRGGGTFSSKFGMWENCLSAA